MILYCKRTLLIPPFPLYLVFGYSLQEADTLLLGINWTDRSKNTLLQRCACKYANCSIAKNTLSGKLLSNSLLSEHQQHDN